MGEAIPSQSVARQGAESKRTKAIYEDWNWSVEAAFKRKNKAPPLIF
jgi:hypothetical protein